MKGLKTLFIALSLILVCSTSSFAGKIKLDHVEPMFWWANMTNPKLQVMVHGENISDCRVAIDYPGVTVERIIKTDNPNYLFVNLLIDKSAQVGTFDILFTIKGKTKASYQYELKQRREGSANRKGFDSSDVVYLITPDRFANGDSSNDIVKGLNEERIDRSDDYARHGGDIKGITNHLDYISDMGFTAIWSTPVLFNDMKAGSYHGYAITDLYQPDPRFGTMEEYIELASKSKEKGMKLVMDQVANHIGLEHWWMKDLPTTNWVNYQEGFEKGEKTNYSNHRRTSNQDTYASKKDKEGMCNGWFTSDMPDLNQRNPFVATYLIQNSIWWVETLDLGGIRQDTYPYPDKEFMSKWAGAIMAEYPNFSIVGEEWSYNPLLVGYWQKGASNKDGYESNLTSTMDFPMQKAIVEALNEEEAWDKGLVKIYEGLANDFHYVRPNDIMIFPDNHDMSRIFTQLKENIVHTKMALGYLLSLPRIAQLYYGTEILMDDTTKPGDHGLIRTDFPGGWENDSVNAFTGEGLSTDQKDMQSFLKKVLNYRKASKAIHQGETVHFAPEKGVYVLFRTFGNETLTVILNKNKEVVNLDLSRFDEIGLEGKKIKNIISGESFKWVDFLTIKHKGITFLTTKR